MHVERHRVDLTTATDGTALGYTPAVTGRVLSIHYIVDATTPFTASTTSLAITTEDMGVSIFSGVATTSFTVHPRPSLHTTTGGALTVTGYGPVAVARERVKVAVASGGASKLGRVDVVIG